MAVGSIQPQSGTQLLILVGAVFLILDIYTGLGEILLALGVGAWLIYNLFNIGRQF